MELKQGLLFVSMSVWLAAVASAQDGGAGLQRPVHTYSIVARDPGTGELGVAVQSHWFSVGPVVRLGRGGRRGDRHAVLRRPELRHARTRVHAGGEGRA